MNPGVSCADMSELLLEADPEELRGEGDSPVAVHVRGCNACTEAARQILRGELDLRNALSRLTTLPAATSVSVASAVPAVTTGRTDMRTPFRSRRARGGLLAASLAAAAVLAVFLVQQRPGVDLPLLDPAPGYMASEPATPVVNVIGRGDVAVLQTTNPNITVIWYLNQEIQ